MCALTKIKMKINLIDQFNLREIFNAIRGRDNLSIDVQKENETHLAAYCHKCDDVRFTDITESTKPTLVSFYRQHQYCA